MFLFWWRYTVTIPTPQSPQLEDIIIQVYDHQQRTNWDMEFVSIFLIAAASRTSHSQYYNVIFWLFTWYCYEAAHVIDTNKIKILIFGSFCSLKLTLTIIIDSNSMYRLTYLRFVSGIRNRSCWINSWLHEYWIIQMARTVPSTSSFWYKTAHVQLWTDGGRRRKMRIICNI